MRRGERVVVWVGLVGWDRGCGGEEMGSRGYGYGLVGME